MTGAPDRSKYPRIETASEKKLVGQRLKMSLSGNKTFELWQGFMKRRKEIMNNISGDLISMQVYDPSFDFKDFNPVTIFEKWAAVEVTDFDNVPEGMETFTLPAGLYVVFLYKGIPENFGEMFQHIFNTWLPSSGYLLDNRPHFEVLGKKYHHGSPDSEEEIWIPVKGIKK